MLRALTPLILRALPRRLGQGWLVAVHGIWPMAGASDDPPADPPADDPPPDPKPDDWSPPDRGAWDNVQRQLRETREKASKLEREQEERDRKAQEDQGRYQELYEQEKQAREQAERDRDEEKSSIESERRRSRGERIASRLNFRDPSDALSGLSDDDLETDSKAEAALKKVADKKPYLIRDSDKRPSRDLGPGDREADREDAEPIGVGRLSRAYANQSKE